MTVGDIRCMWLFTHLSVPLSSLEGGLGFCSTTQQSGFRTCALRRISGKWFVTSSRSRQAGFVKGRRFMVTFLNWYLEGSPTDLTADPPINAKQRSRTGQGPQGKRSPSPVCALEGSRTGQGDIGF